MIEVETVVVTKKPMRSGDVFVDGEGIVWVALNTTNAEPHAASLVYHTPGATNSREGLEEAYHIDDLPRPFRLVVSLVDL